MPTVVPPSPQRQRNLILVSQPSSSGNSTIDTQAAVNSSLVTTFSVAESFTTSSSIVTSISGQHVSTITTTAGTLYYHRYKFWRKKILANLVNRKRFTKCSCLKFSFH